MIDNTIPTPRLVLDAVVFTYHNGALKTVLIRRQEEPEKGKIAIAGGHAKQGSPLLDSVHWVLDTKVGLHPSNISSIEQLYTFDKVGLDPRGHAVTIAFMCLGNQLTPTLTQHQPELFEVNELPETAFAHADILEKGLKTLKGLAQQTTIVKHLLPETFTMSDLHTIYQTLQEEAVDRRNFRKKILKLGVIEPTGEKEKDVPNRPGHLYRFTHKDVVDLSLPLQ